MEQALYRMPGLESVAFFGIRHFSPAGAFHVRRIIEETKPDCLLVELPYDANPLLDELLDPGAIPPVALLAWSPDLPEVSVLPLTEISPELRAIRSAAGYGAEIRFIDLPSEIFLALPEDAAAAHAFDDEWELGFEHADTYAYLEGTRRLSDEAAWIVRAPGSLVGMREGFMRREIERAVSDGFERILVVAGAYHTSRISQCAPLDDRALAALRSFNTECALIPYASDRLEGVRPGYLSMLFDCLGREALYQLPERYFTALAGKIRETGNNCPTGAVIEAARLARSLALVRGKTRPCLTELREAAVCCMSYGDERSIARTMSAVETGSASGSVLRTDVRLPLTADFRHRIKALRLERYLSPEPAPLTLDLRYAEGETGLARKRSEVLHRLRVLESAFVSINSGHIPVHMENWSLSLTPEVNIHLARCVALGGTLERSASAVIMAELAECASVARAVELAGDAALCFLPERLSGALGVLGGCVASAQSFEECARGAEEIRRLITRLSVSGREEAGFTEILRQITLRAVMLLPGAARCDRRAAGAVASGLNTLFDGCCGDEEGGLVRTVERLARDEETSPYLSGLTFALLCERGLIPDRKCESEICKKLSPGTEVTRAAEWFEGLVSRNIYALLSCSALWRALDTYIASLGDEEFLRALVILKRALSKLEMERKSALIRCLENIWNMVYKEYSIGEFRHLNEYKLEELL